MNPRQARRERREAERKAKKLEFKKSRLAEIHPIEIETICPPEPAQLALPISVEEVREEIGFVSQAPSRRAEINRANAQLSTGPRSANGKSASSRNSTKHGLASGQIIITGEDPAAFEALLTDLRKEHQPATATEELLVAEMAQSHWLAQRALRLQTTCFTETAVNEKQLALFLRYQTTHGRAFHKALDTLMKLKKVGFVSQRSHCARQNTTPIGFVSQTAPPSPPAETETHAQTAPDMPPLRKSAA